MSDDDRIHAGDDVDTPDLDDLDRDHPDDVDDAFRDLDAAEPVTGNEVSIASSLGELDQGASPDGTRPAATDEGDDTPDLFQAAAACRYCGREFTRAARAQEHTRFCRDRQAVENGAATPDPKGGVPPVDDDGQRLLQQTAPHEFGAFLKYGIHTDPETGERRGTHGLDPYFALVATKKSLEWDDGAHEGTVEFDGREYSYEFWYDNDNPIAPWDDDSFRLETVDEFVIKCRGPQEIRKATFNISPRWPDMDDVRDGHDGINNPYDLVGVDVDVKGSNHEFDRYPALLDAVATDLGVNGSSSTASVNYFDPRRVKPWSVVYDGERYVRVHEDKAQQLTAMTGPLERMGLFLQDLGSGYRMHEADDTKMTGFRHRAGVGPHRAGELIGGHALAKQAKVYRMREPDAQTGATKHPKLGVKYLGKVQRKSDSGVVYWKHIEDFSRELDEAVINVLSWAGLSVRPRSDTFVADDIFSVEGERRECRIVPDPLPALRDEQEERLTSVINQVTDSDVDVVDRLLADGGTASPRELSEETGWAYRTVLDSLSRLEDVVRHDRGEASIRSQYLAEELLKRLGAIKGNIEHGLTSLRDQLERVVAADAETSPFASWAERYDVEIEDPEDRAFMVLRFGYQPRDYEHAVEILTDGLGSAMRDGIDGLVRDARVDLTTVEGDHFGPLHTRLGDVWGLGTAP